MRERKLKIETDILITFQSVVKKIKFKNINLMFFYIVFRFKENIKRLNMRKHCNRLS